MKRTNVYLDERQLSVLRSLGERRGQPVAELIRSAVDDWLGRQGVVPIPEDEWGERFEQLLTRRRRVAEELGVDERRIQHDVDQVVREVRKARAAGRR